VPPPKAPSAKVDIGLEAGRWSARVPKPDGSASLLHELALSARKFGAEEALRSLGLVSRVVSGSGQRSFAAAFLSLRVGRKRPVAVKRFFAQALSVCFFFSV
jgi:enoyl-CoA hydratase/carnithine racemase